MKTLGVIGGMSWESSAEYYRLINENVKIALGPTHSAELIMYSMDFHAIAKMELEERWSELTTLLVEAITKIENAGADLVLLASNTVHKVADAVQSSIHVPLLHIADATAVEIKAAGIASVGLLGTRFVMEQDFYRERFRDHGIAVMVPDRAGCDYIHKVIYDELCQGKMLRESRERTKAIIGELAQSGAQAIVLGCTELPLLIRTEDSPVRLFDTMAIHARRAVALALTTGNISK